MAKKYTRYRRMIYALLIAATIVFQFSFSEYFKVGFASPLFVLPLVVALSTFENCFWAVIFALFAGVGTDMFSISRDGFYGVIFVLAAFSSSMLVTFLMRRTLVTAVIFALFWSLALNAAYWLFFIVIKGYDSAGWILLHKYLPTAFYSALPVLVYYFPVKLIFEHFEGKAQGNEN